jgi:hypothetical protein
MSIFRPWSVLLVDQHYVEHAHRDSVGGTAVIGDLRWTGSYGINADLIAKTHCSVEYIKTKDIEVFGRSVRFDFNTVSRCGGPAGSGPQSLTCVRMDRQLWKSLNFLLSNTARNKPLKFIRPLSAQKKKSKKWANRQRSPMRTARCR